MSADRMTRPQQRKWYVRPMVMATFNPSPYMFEESIASRLAQECYVEWLFREVRDQERMFIHGTGDPGNIPRGIISGVDAIPGPPRPPPNVIRHTCGPWHNVGTMRPCAWCGFRRWAGLLMRRAIVHRHYQPEPPSGPPSGPPPPPPSTPPRIR